MAQQPVGRLNPITRFDVGIDPGHRFGVAVLKDGKLYEHYGGTNIKAGEKILRDLFRGASNQIHAYIEEPGGALFRPTSAFMDQQSVHLELNKVCRQGMNVGRWLGFFSAFRYKPQLIRADKWQRALECFSSEKALHGAIYKIRFGEEEPQTQKSGKVDYEVVDAALVAEYGRLHHPDEGGIRK